jgi:tetratricopeptide (TPR) repeat protein
MSFLRLFKQESPEARARRLRDEAWEVRQRGGFISTVIIGACQGIQLVEDEALELKRRGDRAYSQGDYLRAADLYEQALHLQEDYVDAHNNLGNAFERLGLYSEALEQYVLAIRLSPEYIVDKIQFIYINIAKTLIRKGMAQSKIGEYQNLTKALHTSSGYYCALGFLWHELGNIKSAKAYYEMSIEADPDGAPSPPDISQAKM